MKTSNTQRRCSRVDGDVEAYVARALECGAQLDLALLQAFRECAWHAFQRSGDAQAASKYMPTILAALKQAAMKEKLHEREKYASLEEEAKAFERILEVRAESSTNRKTPEAS